MEHEVILRRLTGDEINEMPLVHYEGPVEVVRSIRQLEKAMEPLMAEPILGFDTEARPSFRKGDQHLPSLIQLATASCVYLLQLEHVPLSDEVIALLSSEKHIKAGVSIGEDMRELGLLRPFTPQGHVDLADIAEKNKVSSRGLRSLAACFFGERISKGPQCSNWSLPNLSKRQIVYAATDAWMGRRLYMRMLELGMTA